MLSAALLAIFCAKSSPISLAKAFVILPAPPLNTSIGSSCNTSLPIISAINIPGAFLNSPYAAIMVSVNPFALSILPNISLEAACHSSVFMSPPSFIVSLAHLPAGVDSGFIFANTNIPFAA